MKNKLKHIFFASALMAAATNLRLVHWMKLNPGEFTMDSLAETEETYEKIINNCYFAMERYFYGASGASGIESNNWMAMTEATTDLWTYQRNKSIVYSVGFGFMLVHHLIPLILTIFGVVFMMVLVPVI